MVSQLPEKELREATYELLAHEGRFRLACLQGVLIVVRISELEDRLLQEPCQPNHCLLDNLRLPVHSAKHPGALDPCEPCMEYLNLNTS